MSQQERATILLIDDHPMLRTGVKQLISMAPDIQVIGEASNGAQGIELAESLDPDLILLDLNMPGMNGLETLDKLREKSLSGRVVVFSVSNHEEDVVTAQARLPFYQHINTSVSVEQYFGDSVDLFHSGTGYHNPVAVSVGLNYTPVPLVTVTAKHKQGENGVSQNNVGLKLNYRFGVPLKQQLAADEVAISNSLRGSRFDSPERDNLPVVEYRQRKNLTVYLATPPWDLQSGETVQLKLQIHSLHGIKALHWQGDTQALSLTPPVDASSPDGWSIIMPVWNSEPGAANRWRLSVVVEDKQGQRVSSNEIALALTEPLVKFTTPGVSWTDSP